MPATPLRSPESSGALLEELARELREIRASQGFLIPPAPLVSQATEPAPDPAERPAEVSSSRAPVGGDTAESAGPEPLHPELVRWMQRIEKRLALAGSSGNTALRLPPPGYAASTPALPAANDEDQEAFARTHFLWSLQDVLDVYGAPDIVHPDGNGVEWEYKYPEGSSLGDVHFVFHNGLCVSQFAH